MKNHVFVILVALLLTACASPKSSTPTATGISDLKGLGISHQRQLALLDAQTLLAYQLENHVNAAMSRFASSKGLNKEMYAKQNTQTRNDGTIDKTVVGITIYQSIQSPSGIYYVLVGLDEKNYQLNTQKKVKTQIDENGEAWLPLTQESSTDALVNDISQYLGE